MGVVFLMALLCREMSCVGNTRDAGVGIPVSVEQFFYLFMILVTPISHGLQ